MFKVLSTTLILTVSGTFSAIAAGGGLFFPSNNAYPVFDAGTVPCPERYDPRSVCRRLNEEFGYFINERGFEAKAGLITDGASIPFWAQSFIGAPHAKAFSRAATLHDHYVLDENAVYSYLVVQRMFFDALVDSGVPRGKAKAMYAAVLIGASKWTIFYDAKPEACVLSVPNCIRSPLDTTPDDVRDSTPSVFSSPDFLPMVNSITGRADFDALSVEDIERLAISTRLLGGIATPTPMTFGEQE